LAGALEEADEASIALNVGVRPYTSGAAGMRMAGAVGAATDALGSADASADVTLDLESFQGHSVYPLTIDHRESYAPLGSYNRAFSALPTVIGAGSASGSLSGIEYGGCGALMVDELGPTGSSAAVLASLRVSTLMRQRQAEAAADDGFGDQDMADESCSGSGAAAPPKACMSMSSFWSALILLGVDVSALPFPVESAGPTLLWNIGKCVPLPLRLTLLPVVLDAFAYSTGANSTSMLADGSEFVYLSSSLVQAVSFCLLLLADPLVSGLQPALGTVASHAESVLSADSTGYGAALGIYALDGQSNNRTSSSPSIVSVASAGVKSDSAWEHHALLTGAVLRLLSTLSDVLAWREMQTLLLAQPISMLSAASEVDAADIYASWYQRMQRVAPSAYTRSAFTLSQESHTWCHQAAQIVATLATQPTSRGDCTDGFTPCSLGGLYYPNLGIVGTITESLVAPPLLSAISPRVYAYIDSATGGETGIHYFTVRSQTLAPVSTLLRSMCFVGVSYIALRGDTVEKRTLMDSILSSAMALDESPGVDTEAKNSASGTTTMETKRKRSIEATSLDCGTSDFDAIPDIGEFSLAAVRSLLCSLPEGPPLATTHVAAYFNRRHFARKQSLPNEPRKSTRVIPKWALKELATEISKPKTSVVDFSALMRQLQANPAGSGNAGQPRTLHGLIPGVHPKRDITGNIKLTSEVSIGHLARVSIVQTLLRRSLQLFAFPGPAPPLQLHLQHIQAADAKRHVRNELSTLDNKSTSSLAFSTSQADIIRNEDSRRLGLAWSFSFNEIGGPADKISGLSQDDSESELFLFPPAATSFIRPAGQVILSGLAKQSTVRRSAATGEPESKAARGMHHLVRPDETVLASRLDPFRLRPPADVHESMAAEEFSNTTTYLLAVESALEKRIRE
jgi:hypothetical protein